MKQRRFFRTGAPLHGFPANSGFRMSLFILFRIKHFGANIWRLIAEIRARAAVANACYLTAARGLARIDFSAMTSCSLQKFHAGSAGVQVPFL